MKRIPVASVASLLCIALSAAPVRAGDLLWESTGGPGGTVVQSMLLAPSGTLLVGTEYAGLYRSEDGGQSWTEIGDGLGWPCCNYIVPALAADGERLFAGTWGGGVHVSLDDGVTWSPGGTIPGDPYPVVLALAACRHGERLYAGGNFGVARSEDDGMSWDAASDGLPASWVRSLALRGPDLFARLDEGIYRLDRATESWVEWNEGLPTVAGMQSLCVAGDALHLATHEGGVFHLDCSDSAWTQLADGLYDDNVTCLARAGDVLYAGLMGNGVFRLDPVPWLWSETNDDLWNRDVRAMAHRGLVPFAGTFGAGVFALDLDAGAWIWRSDGMASPLVASLVVDGTTVYAGVQGGGVFVSGDGGAVWSRASEGLNDINVHVLARDASRLYCGTWNGVFKSDDGGAVWTESGAQGNGIFSLVAAGDELYAGTHDGEVYVSTNGGDSWAPLGTGLPGLEVRGIAVLAGTRYAAVNGWGVYALPPGETTWQAMNSGLPESYLRSLAMSGGELFLGTEAHGVWRWNETVATWEATGLTEGTIFCLADVGPRLFAGSWGGLAATDDGGDTWTDEHDGLKPWSPVLAVAGGADYAFAGLGAGVWRAANPVAAPDIAPALGEWPRVEPNPFTAGATVAFVTDRRGPVEVTVHDASGRRVGVLVDGVLDPGRHERVWSGALEDGRRAPAGVYWIRVAAEGREVNTRAVRVR